MQEVSITILNWSKYQSMSEQIRYPYWFRVHRDVCFSPGLIGLSPAQKWLWVILLCECCKKKSDTVSLNFHWLINASQIKKNDILQAFEMLSINGTITVNSRSTHGGLNTEEIRGEERKEEKKNILSNRTDRTFDFESLYLKYPRKEGKTKGIDICKRSVKTLEDFNQLETAIQNYSKICAAKDPKFIKLFSTFMSTWRDWLDPEHGQLKVVDEYAIDIEKILARNKSNGLHRL